MAFVDERFVTRLKIWLRVLFLVLFFNLLFVLLAFTSTIASRTKIIAQIRQAFKTGELGDSDYLHYDSRRGFHQYNDCVILQMISNPDASLTGKALGPKVFLSESSEHGVCSILRELILSESNTSQSVASRYTRYWHGYIPITAALLSITDISTSRISLRAGVYISILLLFLAGIREREFAPLTSSIAIAGMLFWGLPYFGQGFSHGPGDAAIMLGIAGLVFWHRRFSCRPNLFAFCAIFGTIIVYFEMLTGQLPTASGLLFTTVYLVSRVNNPLETPLNHFRLAVDGLLAFALGAALTVATRVLIAALFVRPNGLDVFFYNLERYTRPISTGSIMGDLFQLLEVLIRRGEVLTYGSRSAMLLLYLTAAITWTAALLLAYKRETRMAWADLAAFTVGATSIVVWILILQTHTLIHAGFMVRMLIVPISLGWAACLWQIQQWRTKFRGQDLMNGRKRLKETVLKCIILRAELTSYSQCILPASTSTGER